MNYTDVNDLKDKERESNGSEWQGKVEGRVEIVKAITEKALKEMNGTDTDKY